MITIGRAFSGPPGTGNGGYVCGTLADHIDGPAEITLKKPCPLETSMDVVDFGDHLSLMSGNEEIAAGKSADPDLRAREPISFDAAVSASRGFSGFQYHPFPACFVCGTELAEGVGLRIYAGPLTGHPGVVAAPWIPHANYADQDGTVRDRFIWSALDCPGAFTVVGEKNAQILLGRLNVQILNRPRVGEACVVQGWKLGEEGRKIFTGTALYGEDGGHLAVARATWIVATQE